MSFLDAREHGSKPGSGGAASLQNEVRLPTQKWHIAKFTFALIALWKDGATWASYGLVVLCSFASEEIRGQDFYPDALATCPLRPSH
jgi:hypothetical protein